MTDGPDEAPGAASEAEAPRVAPLTPEEMGERIKALAQALGAAGHGRPFAEWQIIVGDALALNVFGQVVQTGDRAVAYAILAGILHAYGVKLAQLDRMRAEREAAAAAEATTGPGDAAW